MPNLITHYFGNYNAKVIESTFNSTANTFYFFAANHLPFENDLTPPNVNNSIKFIDYAYHDQLIFGKRITDADVEFVVKKHVWTLNEVYDIYDDIQTNLNTKKFFVVYPEGGSYHVFKCLDNNNGAPSQFPPLKSETSESDILYKKADGYQWKYLYTITNSQWVKFNTAEYMPVYVNSNTVANAVAGAIDVIKIESGGTNYNSYANGFFSTFNVEGNTQVFGIDSSAASNTDFYRNSSIYISSGTGAGQLRDIVQYTVSGNSKRVIIDSPWSTSPDATSKYEIAPRVLIAGDGVNAKARAIVNPSTNSISRIDIVSRGSNYTFANVVIEGNTGFIDTGNTVILANTAVARVILGPKEGHGSDVYSELYSTNICISASFANTESDTLPITNNFRTFGILNRPAYANLVLSVSSVTGTFTANTLIEQPGTGATGRILFANSSSMRLTNATGIFNSNSYIRVSGNNSVNAAVTSVSTSQNYFDQRTIFQINVTNSGLSGNGFILNEKVTQSITNASGYIYSSNSSVISLTNVKGNFAISDVGDPKYFTGETSGAVAQLNGVNAPSLVKYSGDIFYIENVQPIQRADNQTETFKVIIKLLGQ